MSTFGLEQWTQFLKEAVSNHNSAMFRNCLDPNYFKIETRDLARFNDSNSDYLKATANRLGDLFEK